MAGSKHSAVGPTELEARKKVMALVEKLYTKNRDRAVELEKKATAICASRKYDSLGRAGQLNTLMQNYTIRENDQ